MSTNPLDLARDAYSRTNASATKQHISPMEERANRIADAILARLPQSQPAPEAPKRDLSGMTPNELASLAYSLNDRERDTRKVAAKPALSNVLDMIDRKELPEALRPLALQPPTKQEARYLPKDVQTLISELDMLDRVKGALPGIETEVKTMTDQREAWIREAARSGITYHDAIVNGIVYPHNLESTERTLTKFTTERDAIVRGSKNFAEHNPDLVQRAVDRMTSLRNELDAPITYAEARDGIPVNRKTVAGWLEDIRNKPGIENRLLAQQVLSRAGVDARAIFTEVERDGMDRVDRAIAESKDGAGNQAATNAPSGAQA